MVPRGATHISCHHKNTIEGTREKQNKRTNTNNMLGVNSRAKRGVIQHYISDRIYGLTLAWITSENSTKQLESRYLDSIFFAGLYIMLPRLSAQVSTLDRLCPCPVANSVSSFIQATLFSRPVTTSGHTEISIPKPFVWFRAKTDKGIVCLSGHLHSVTPTSYPCHLFTINYNTIQQQ